MTQPATDNTRHRLYKLLQVGKRDLRMDDDAYRALLARHGATHRNGRPSAATMSLSGLHAAVAEMKAKGFAPRPGRGSAHRVDDRRRGLIAKITAIWCALADAGVVRDRSEAAMVKWCSRHTNVPRLQWAKAADLVRCIEALKSWAAREHVELQD